jgi:acyl carrier protein
VTEPREHFIDHDFHEPAGETEEAVSRILADVLGVDRMGRSDSFYAFGGTSLQAIRICARVEAKFGCPADPVWLFTNDVLADFAAKLDSERALAGDPSA